jgi:hypothetical protein
MATRTRAPKKSSPADNLLSELVNQLTAQKGNDRDKFVGIRNISNACIGVPNPVRGQVDLLNLHSDFIDPTDPTAFMPNPNATQVVTHAVWMQLRRSSHYDNGLIVRDDSILGDSYEPAQADAPNELAPNWAKNAVINPAHFIESRNEQELASAIGEMTSELSLKRLLTAVNQRIEKQRLVYSEDDPRREERALSGIPAIYTKVEQLVLDRLEALSFR